MFLCLLVNEGFVDILIYLEKDNNFHFKVKNLSDMLLLLYGVFTL